MGHDTISVAAVLRDGIAGKRYNDSIAIASTDIETAEQRLWMARALRCNDAMLLAPRVYWVRSPAAVLATIKTGIKRRLTPPPPHETAIALSRQNNWQLSFPLLFCAVPFGLDREAALATRDSV